MVICFIRTDRGKKRKMRYPRGRAKIQQKIRRRKFTKRIYRQTREKKLKVFAEKRFRYKKFDHNF